MRICQEFIACYIGVYTLHEIFTLHFSNGIREVKLIYIILPEQTRCNTMFNKPNVHK